MKRLYTIGMGLTLGLLSTQAGAQVQQAPYEVTKPLTSTITKKASDRAVAKGDSELEIYWSEDFSNGFDGQDDNGEWTTQEAQGELWFITYPAEEPNGYNPDAALVGASPEYGTQIPNYFGAREAISSPTRDNGFAMVDGDRWNSTSTVEAPEGTLTQDPFLAALVSPTISLPDGATNALLIFNQYARLCCSGYALSVDISVDGGTNWIPYDVFTPYGEGNDDIDIEVSLNISDVLQGAADLNNIRLRFFWNGSQSHYFWMIDDIRIQELPPNDLIAGATFYNDYHELNAGFTAGTVSAVDYYREFEYQTHPDFLTRPLDFAMVVTNGGSEIQTMVQMSVEVTRPDGTTYGPITSDPISLESGVTDTLTANTSVTFAELGDPIQTGQYLFNFTVIQEQVDDRPDDNVGPTRGTNVSPDILRNDGNNYQGAYTTLGQDVIWSTPYVFAEPVAENSVITHVEAVFLFSDDFAETIAGEVVYFNVRDGSVLEEDPEDPNTFTTVYFDDENPIDYDDPSLEYTIEESDIWDNTDGFPFVWASFELPSPILIEANRVYQAEYRIPPAGGPIVFSPVTSPQEQYAGTLYDFADGAWFFLGTNAMPIRFRVASAVSVPEVTYESGIKLLQNYPNPFIDVTRIQYSLDETAAATFMVHDITGKLVFSEELGIRVGGSVYNYELEKGNLNAGMYTYSIVTPDATISRKLTVQ